MNILELPSDEEGANDRATMVSRKNYEVDLVKGFEEEV